MSFTESETALGKKLFEACSFTERPICKESHLATVRDVMRNNIPATITTSDLGLFTDEEEATKKKEIIQGDITIDGTTPLHVICLSFPSDASSDELQVALEMMRELFQWGAGWMLLDEQGQTPGCVAWERSKGGARDSVLASVYNEIVSAGTRSEVFLRRINKSENVEFLSDDEDEEMEVDEEEEEEETGDIQQAIADAIKQAKEAGLEVVVDGESVDEVPELVGHKEGGEEDIKSGKEENEEKEETQKETKEVDLAGSQMDYLKDKLTYTEDNKTLITTQNDGVMMDWEDEIMQKSADLLVSRTDKDSEGPVVLNVGFGLGIIDRYLQEKKPSKHYICEAHPDVLEKMEKDGWMEKPGVTVLVGRWQDTLPELLSQGVYFDGMYYDTFSENYSDLVDFFDHVVGLLAPTGVFSFFNGLGADRQVCYDVYKNVVEVDLQEYGLNVEYQVIKVNKDVTGADGHVWDGIKRRYWVVEDFYLPVCTF
ncbi:Protein arginine N-methyltransferase 2 [Yarrowia sp. C11]|nr:Protein arginine N-methyltransferase 2 [Yarrowia sp. E02]KAG5371705.1 Protein arginine N-methyltransferase 2 [Yarrowia sp. C11]